MKRKDDLLWKVLRATTNSPNDVWKEEHYRRHKGISKEIIGTTKVRYTVPIKRILDIEEDTVYLVVQFSTDELPFPFFVIDREAFTKSLKAPEEYVYAFNVRLCLKSEFKFRHRKQLNIKGKVKREYRSNIINSALTLINSKPRYKLINLMRNSDKYKNASLKIINKIIYADQFNEDEKRYKGITRDKRRVDKKK